MQNTYNGVVCNDIILATGVFSSRELWKLTKGEGSFNYYPLLTRIFASRSFTFPSHSGSILEETASGGGDSYLQSNILQMQHDSLIKMESAGATTGGAGTSSAMSPPSASVVGGGNYFNLNSLIATPTSNAQPHNVQSTSPIPSSIILATSVQNHHGLHGNLLFDSIAGGNTCPSSPTLLTPSSTHHLTHLTPPDHHNHHHYLHYHHSMHHHHHMSPHHAHLAMPPQGSLIMSASGGGSQSPGSSGSALMLHNEGQFQQQQQNYLSAKMESPGSMEALNQEHRLQEVGGAGGQQQQQQQHHQGGPTMMLGNSYSM